MSTSATRYGLQWQSATIGAVSAAHAISTMNDADGLRICTYFCDASEASTLSYATATVIRGWWHGFPHDLGRRCGTSTACI
jgi:hypothetical protein